MATQTRLKVGVVGVSGYSGGELIRLLASHPGVALTVAAARDRVGMTIDELHPGLAGLPALAGLALSEPAAVVDADLDVVFLALPHGESMTLVPRLSPSVKVVDLSGDYRLQDPASYTRHYGRPHTDPLGISGFRYGLPELDAEGIKTAQRVANPGCFATAAALALAPATKAGLVEGTATVAAVTGSSGAGSKPQSTTHHPFRAESFAAYKVGVHQHTPEIVQTLRSGGSQWDGNLLLQTHTSPLVRGIYATAFARLSAKALSAGADEAAAVVSKAYADAYVGRPLMRLRQTPPDAKWVRGTPFADVHWSVQGDTLVAFCALDNLMKGAASQAVQNMNLMCGLDETAGLTCYAGGSL
jgi:N-acetyl-gamma-glutamyl-phosphate/LysW-gamma-L-alpha-aminoadipyl-6-phosphate reductase